VKYTCVVRGPLPPELSQRIASAHAEAVARRTALAQAGQAKAAVK
jgi:hypothetical protein